MCAILIRKVGSININKLECKCYIIAIFILLIFSININKLECKLY